jgi:hypothetical protein
MGRTQSWATFSRPFGTKFVNPRFSHTSQAAFLSGLHSEGYVMDGQCNDGRRADTMPKLTLALTTGC